jgi:CDP-diacylglycerol--serine O-phosphatidyltransferase
MLKHFLNPPNWFTSASIFCGFYAIVLAAGNIDANPAIFYKAGLMIFFAGVFDMLDGRVARLTGRGSDFGVQLDSLADAVSFGVAPATLAWSWGLKPLGIPGLLFAFFFALCGIFRLARFNIVEADTTTKADFSKGLTITMAGGTLASMVMVHVAIGRADVAHPMNVLLVMAALSMLMVSEVPYHGLKAFRLKRLTIVGLALFLGFCITVSIVYRNIAYLLFLVGTVHIISGPMMALLGFRARRRALSRHGFTIDLDDDDE